MHSPSWLSYVPLDTVKHLPSLQAGAATRLIILYQWRGAPFKTLLPSSLMPFQQILETVVIMPTYQTTIVNSLLIAYRVVLLLLISVTFLYNILLQSPIIAFYIVDFIFF